MDMDRPTATTSDGSVRKEVASNVHIGDGVCPECGNEIGESDPRRVYQVAGVVRLGHKGCADRVEMADGYVSAAPPPPPQRIAAHTVSFPDFDALQDFVIKRGAPIPSEVRVVVSDMVLQEGRK